MKNQSPREMAPNHNSRDEVLKRMLKMPPKPHEFSGSKKKGPAKRAKPRPVKERS